MTKAFYSGFYPDGLGVGGTALGSTSRQGIEDIIKNLDDISIQRLVEARAQLNLKLSDLNDAVEAMEGVINVTIPSRLADAEHAINVTIPSRIADAELAITNNRTYAETQLSTAVTNFNNKISLTSPDAGSIGARVLAYQGTLDGHALRLDGLEVIMGTDDGQGTVMGRIASLEEITTDGTLVTSTQFNSLVSSLSQYSKVFAQPSQPTTGMVAGDLWIDTDDGNKMYRYSGTTWANVTPASSSMRTFAQPEPPTTASTDDLWFDTNDNNKMYRRQGTNWVPVEDLRIGSITSSINSLNQTVADLENNKAEASTVAGIQSEISNARGGQSTLAAKLTQMDNARVDGLALKADASRVSALEATVNTAGTGLTAKVGALEIASSNLQTGKADASRVSQLEVQAVKGKLGGSLTDTSLFTTATSTPTTAASLTQGANVTLPTGGQVREFPGLLLRIFGKGWLRIEAGKTYKVKTRVRATVAGSETAGAVASFLLSDDLSASSLGTPQSAVVPLTVGDWKEIEYTRTAEQLWALNANAKWVRGNIRFGFGTVNAGINAGATVQVDYLEYEDATDLQVQGAKITTLEQATSNLQTGKADASRVSALEATVNTAGTGLTAKVSSLETATTNLQTGKADASALTSVSAKVDNLDNIRRYESIGGHPGQTPEKFTSTLTGSPTASPNLVMTNATIETNADEGKVLRITNVARHVWSKGWIPLAPGETHRISVRARVVTDGPNANRTQVGVRLSNEAGENAGQQAGQLIHTAADGWQTIVYERTTQQLIASAVAGTTPTHFRVGCYAGVISTGTSASGATVEIAWVKYENITEVKSLGASVTTLSNAVSDLQTGKADASRVSALEATVNTAGTGLSAKVSGLETATSNLQTGKADASRVSALEVQGSKGALGGSVADGSLFTLNSSGLPGATTPLTLGSVVSLGGGEKVREITTTDRIYVRGWMRIQAGKTYRVRTRYRLTAVGSQPSRFACGFLLSNDAGGWVGNPAGGTVLMTLSNGWVVTELLRTAEQLWSSSPDAVWLRGYIRMLTDTGGNYSGGTAQIDTLEYEEVTDALAAEGKIQALETATANLQTGKADASRVSALEATVNTAGTGLSAKVASLETATANLQSGKADASRVTALEATVVTSPNLLPNGGVEFGTQGLSAYGPGGATIFAGVDQDWGPYAQVLGSANGTYSIHWPQFPVRAGGTYVVSGDTAFFHAGGGGGDSYLDILYLNSAGSIVLDGPQKAIVGQHDFSNGADRLQAHAVQSTAPATAVKAYVRAIFTSMTAPTFMGARRVKVERGVLPATAFTSEKSDTMAVARIASAESAIIDLNNGKASASQVNEISASLEQYPNLILNSDFTQGSQDWVFTGPWAIHHDAAWGSMAMALGGTSEYHYIWQDVPIYANNTYTLSWTGDGGAYPERVNIYVECKNAAGTTLGAYGNVKMTGMYWHQRKSFSFTTPANTAYVRVIVQKNSTGAHFDCFVSRFMLNYGEHPRRWTNDSNVRSVGARVTTVSNAVTNLQTGKADASRVSTLEADLNTAGSGIKARLTTTEAVAVAANGKAQSTYGVVAEAGGSIVGFQLAAGGNSSSFKIRADKFEVASPSSTGARTVYSGNSWKVYDNNNVLRVEMGVF